MGKSIGEKARLSFACSLSMMLIIGSYSTAAIRRNNAYQDEYTLNMDNIRKSSQKGRPYLNLGLFYANQNKVDDAIREYMTALQFAPDYSYAHNNLGVAYYKKGYMEAAAVEFKEALRLFPDYAEAHYNLGIVYGEKGLAEEAYREIKKAMELNKNLSEELK